MQRIMLPIAVLAMALMRPGPVDATMTYGPLTTGVGNPGDAFDGNPATHATLAWYWNEGGHYDFLHLIDVVGQTDVFEFTLDLGHGTPGSTLEIEGFHSSTSDWEHIDSVPLGLAGDEGFSQTVVVMNAQSYVSDGTINLRARWVGGTSAYDVWFREITVVPEPSTALLLAFGLVGLAAGRRRKMR